jgi:AmmeMemoRadiSam system protein B/AmmeMemoRadiSam system protein A
VALAFERRFGQDRIMSSTVTVDQALEQAAARWSGGDRAAARQLVQQVLNAVPDHPGALNLAGCAAFEDGHPDLALALFEKAVALSPADAPIQANLARSEFAVGRVERARRRADYLATIAPQVAGMPAEFAASLAAARRPSAIASSFYPGDAQALAREVDGHLHAAALGMPRSMLQQPKVLIAPHAGHVYSGGTAARAYARIQPFAGAIRRVVLLGPAHRVYFQGVALPGTGAWVTPLGAVPIDTLGADAVADLPFVVTRADAHGPEHSLEVHLPFLQRVLGDFELLPLVVGDVAPAHVAALIARLWGGPETLILISTDLSHFHAYDEAQRIDAASCAQVMALDASLTHEQACGATPVNALLQLARARGLRIEQIERCNSGDTAGDRERVVGYASFALYEPKATGGADARSGAGDGGALTAEQGLALVQLARASLHEATGAGREPVPGLKSFQAPGAAFVTLTSQGRLRGCIGSLQATRPLADDVRANAAAAALQDPRFSPVSAAEAPGLEVEVSVLSAPRPLIFANESHALWQLRPGEDGVILECEHQGRSHRSTYLPQVWEQIASPRAFLAHLKVKAGLPFDFWSPQLRLATYRVQKFSEAQE